MRGSNHLPRVWHPYLRSTLKSSPGWTMVIPSKDLPTYTKKTYAKSCMKDKKNTTTRTMLSTSTLHANKFTSCLLRNCEGLLFAHFFLKASLTVGAFPYFVIYIVDFSLSVLEHGIIAVTAKCQVLFPESPEAFRAHFGWHNSLSNEDMILALAGQFKQLSETIA